MLQLAPVSPTAALHIKSVFKVKNVGKKAKKIFFLLKTQKGELAFLIAYGDLFNTSFSFL